MCAAVAIATWQSGQSSGNIINLLREYEQQEKVVVSGSQTKLRLA